MDIHNKQTLEWGIWINFLGNKIIILFRRLYLGKNWLIWKGQSITETQRFVGVESTCSWGIEEWIKLFDNISLLPNLTNSMA